MKIVNKFEEKCRKDKLRNPPSRCPFSSSHTPAMHNIRAKSKGNNKGKGKDEGKSKGNGKSGRKGELYDETQPQPQPPYDNNVINYDRSRSEGYDDYTTQPLNQSGSPPA